MAHIEEEENYNINDEEPQPTKNNETKESDSDKIALLLEVPRCQFFVIKNDQRKQLSCGKLQIITDEPNRTELVFVFPDYPQITHTMCITTKRPAIKMCHSDYIFINDSIDSFGLYIDTRALQQNNNMDLLQQFEQLISTYCHFKISSKSFPIHKYPINDELTVGPPDKIAIAGMKLATLICKGSVITAKGIRKATLIGTRSINKSKRFLKTKLTPNEDQTKISPKVQNGLAKAQIGGKALVKVSGAVLTGAIAAANALSNEVTEAVSNSSVGQKLSSESGPKSKAAKEIVKSTVAGAYTVYDELVNSGLHLVQQSSHATAEVLGHKYGDEVHRAAESTADIVDSAANAVVNVNMLGYKALAKRIAANSTVDVLSDEVERKENQSKRVGVNPVQAMQGFVVVNNLNNELEQQKKEDRKRRQEYVGIEGVDESNENYRVAQNANNEEYNYSEEIINGVSNVINQAYNNNLQQNNNFNHVNSNARNNNNNVNENDRHLSIFEDATLDVD